MPEPSYTPMILSALRAIAPEGKLTQAEVNLVYQLSGLWLARELPAPATQVAESEPKWITVGRRLIGEREIPGPKHNSWIANGWARLGAKWLNDDESPWCGFYVAHCIDAAGLPIPGGGLWCRAMTWATWGIDCSPRFGAIGVKKRKGGAHVFFIVGETPDGRFFKVLEGNANNCVRVGDVAKGEVIAIRWPQGAHLRKLPLLILPKGSVALTED